MYKTGDSFEGKFSMLPTTGLAKFDITEVLMFVVLFMTSAAVGAVNKDRYIERAASPDTVRSVYVDCIMC